MRGIIVSPVDVDTVVNKTEFASLMSLNPLLNLLKFLYESPGRASFKLTLHVCLHKWILLEDRMVSYS